MRLARVGVLALLLAFGHALGGSSAPLPASASAQSRARGAYQAGALFVALSGPGRVQWYGSDGTLGGTLQQQGNAAAGMAFDRSGNLYAADSNRIEKYGPDGRFLGPFVQLPNGELPYSLSFDSAGNAYVGTRSYGGNPGLPLDVYKLSPSGAVLAHYDVNLAIGLHNGQPDIRSPNGPRWVQIGSDRCTLYYSVPGDDFAIRRFDVCRNAQLTDVGTGVNCGATEEYQQPPSCFGFAYQFELLPDGGIIVANGADVERLDASGAVLQRYNPPDSPGGWTTAALAGDGKSFWAGSEYTGYNTSVYRFDLASGQVVQTIKVGDTANALAVFKGTSSTAPSSLTLTPSSVKRGHTVLIKGSADGCAVGDTVFILSKAFVHMHDFAGLPAVLAKVRYGGSFRVTTTIPAAKRPGRYWVTARCGGGNLGVREYLTVRR